MVLYEAITCSKGILRNNFLRELANDKCLLHWRTTLLTYRQYKLRLHKLIHVMKSSNCSSWRSKVRKKLAQIQVVQHTTWKWNLICSLTIRSTITNNKVSFASVKMSNDLEKDKEGKATVSGIGSETNIIIEEQNFLYTCVYTHNKRKRNEF